VRNRRSARKSFFAFTMSLACAGCAPTLAPHTEPWMPIPGYGQGLDASVGALCGHGGAPSQVGTSTVDVLIDSTGSGGLSQLPVIVEPLPSWQLDRPSPVIGIAVTYPRPGAATLREHWRECTAAEGATVRINAATVGHAELGIAASGPVRITARAIDGRALGEPIVLTPGMARVIMRWPSVRAGT
jgi:hypothetical protein